MIRLGQVTFLKGVISAAQNHQRQQKPILPESLLSLNYSSISSLLVLVMS
jgi:hypothetical protein